MAVSVIDPDNGSPTPEYLSVGAWVTGETGGQSGAVCRADCRPTSGSDDTSNWEISGFSNYSGLVTIQPQSDTYRHDGTKAGNSLAAKCVAEDWNPISVAQAGVRVIGMVIENSQTDGDTVIANNHSGGGDNEFVENLIIGGTIGVYVRSDHNAYIVNNILYGAISAASHGVRLRAGASGNEWIIYSNTIIGPGASGAGIEDSLAGGDPTQRVFNNICQDWTDCYDLTYADATGGNISDDATSPQTALRSISLTFEAAGSDDYHLDSGDSDAIDGGDDLDADSYYAVTSDIDGDSRDASTPDIGADETAAAGSAGHPWFYRQHLSSAIIGIPMIFGLLQGNPKGSRRDFLKSILFWRAKI